MCCVLLQNWGCAEQRHRCVIASRMCSAWGITCDQQIWRSPCAAPHCIIMRVFYFVQQREPHCSDPICSESTLSVHALITAKMCLVVLQQLLLMQRLPTVQQSPHHLH